MAAGKEEGGQGIPPAGFMDTLYIDYDDTLIGRTPYVDAYNFYGPEPGGANERKALGCIRYALEKVLGWTPEEAVQKFDAYIIRVMKLDRMVSYIDFPVEVPYGNVRYILSRLYPGLVRINREKLVEETFEAVLESARRKEAAKEAGNADTERLKQFPREYFSGTDGFRRFACCIKYIIENYKPMGSVGEVYDFFSSPDGRRLLYDFRLKVPADQFSIDLMSVIRYITRDEPDSDLYFSYYAFKRELDALLREKNGEKEEEEEFPEEEYEDEYGE